MLNKYYVVSWSLNKFNFDISLQRIGLEKHELSRACCCKFYFQYEINCMNFRNLKTIYKHSRSAIFHRISYFTLSPILPTNELRYRCILNISWKAVRKLIYNYIYYPDFSCFIEFILLHLIKYILYYILLMLLKLDICCKKKYYMAP